MSDKERPRAEHSGSGSGGGGGLIGGGSGDDGEETTESGDPNEQNCAGCGKKGKKKMSFFRLRKGKKRKKQPRGVYVNSGCWMKRAGRGCSCFNRPRTADSSGESPTTSDPNNSEFSFDMLRGLIEKNDFYSKDCNPHLDIADDFYVKEAHEHT